MNPSHPQEPEHSHACGCAAACDAKPTAPAEALPDAAGIPVFRIPTMDCAAEEGEIRHALAHIPGLRTLNFRLGARTLVMVADPDYLAVRIYRSVGFVDGETQLQADRPPPTP